MVTSQEKRRLIEAYSGRQSTHAALPVTIVGLLVVVSVAVIAALHSDNDSAATAGLTAKQVVTGR